MISKAEREKVREQVRKELEDEREEKEHKSAVAAIRQEMESEERKKEWDNGTVPIYIDLAPNASELTINGQKFYHGHTYYVTPEQHASKISMIWNTWRHEREVKGQIKERGPTRDMRVGATGASGPLPPRNTPVSR